MGFIASMTPEGVQVLYITISTIVIIPLLIIVVVQQGRTCRMLAELKARNEMMQQEIDALQDDLSRFYDN